VKMPLGDEDWGKDGKRNYRSNWYCLGSSRIIS
jgi:hypothetical protein